MNKTMHIQEEAARCLLCADAPCSKACKNGDPARAMRAIRFDSLTLTAHAASAVTYAASSVLQKP